MIGIEEALQRVLSHAQSLTALEVPLAGALGLILAEDVASDIDSPPHDKSVVDGFAVQAASAKAGTELVVLEEVVAGQLPSHEVTAGTATRIMTGAPIPHGADAVIMVERTEILGSVSPPRVRLLQDVKAGQNIMRQAASMRRGETVLHGGRRLSGIEIGLLAEVGRSRVRVVPRPSVAVLATGNELVGVDVTPAAGLIRNSNGPMLAALAQQGGAVAAPLGVARDDASDLRAKIEQGLMHDVLVLSGGVSEGVLDLVPRVLTEAGVEPVFHKVHLKPGKPLWFGICRSNQKTTLVFGLPGNPVSSLVCFQLFVLPALQAMMGDRPTGLPRLTVPLAASHFQRGDRPTYWPATWIGEFTQRSVKPLAWQGSGDLRTLAAADGLAFFPAGDRMYEIGEQVEVLYWR